MNKNILPLCIIKLPLFILILLLPIVTMFFSFPEIPLNDHDFGVLYGRNFLNPEHGRYIATCFGHFLVEQLPVYLNIHVSDLNVSVFLWVKIFISTIVFLLVSFGFILFSDKNRSDIWIWLLCYNFSFFILYNNRFFFFSIFELTVFLEYIAGLIPYLIFLCGVYYFYSKEKIPTKPIYILILLSAFFSGITVELLNVPSLMLLSFITLLVIVDYLKSDKPDTAKNSD